MVKHRCLNHLKRQVLEEQIKSDFYFLEEWELQLKITSLEVCNPNMLMSHEIQALVQRALAALPVQTRKYCCGAVITRSPTRRLPLRLVSRSRLWRKACGLGSGAEGLLPVLAIDV